MFFTGLWLGGHLFRLGPNDQGFAALLQLLPMVANVGAGLPYLFCWLTNNGFADHAQMVTYEYGNTFLLVAGLLNYLAMLDAFEPGTHRPQFGICVERLGHAKSHRSIGRKRSGQSHAAPEGRARPVLSPCSRKSAQTDRPSRLRL